MPFRTRLTRKGQVTVPVEIRRKLGLKQGDRVEFADKGKETVIRRAPDEGNSFDRYKGAYPGLGGDVKAINRWISQLREGEDER